MDDDEMTVIELSELAGQLLWIMDDRVKRDYVQISFEMGSMFGAKITVSELHDTIKELAGTGMVWEIGNYAGSAAEYRIAGGQFEWGLLNSDDTGAKNVVTENVLSFSSRETNDCDD